ncbi:MAG: DUF2510 domain-containing protein [Actinomycetota bacterium]
MSDEGGQATPGWYPDPEAPSRLRYWDGEVWTDHYHDGQASGPLPAIGEWFSSTFAAIGAFGIPAAGLAVMVSIVRAAVFGFGLFWALDGVVRIDDEFDGNWGQVVGRSLAIGLVFSIAQAVAWLAVNRFMQRAHLNQEPTITEAMGRAVTRLPRLIGAWLLVFAAFVVLMIVISLLGAVAGALTALAILGLIPLGVWAWIKLAFLSSAAVAAPPGASILRASGAVSQDGRFWAVFGRLLLITISVTVMVAIVSGVIGAGQPIDPNEVEDVVTVVDDDVIVRDFTVAQFRPSNGALFYYALASGIVTGLGRLITTSGVMRLYLDSGAPSSLE